MTLAVIVALLGLYTMTNTYYSRETTYKLWWSKVVAESTKYSISPSYVLAVLFQESGGNPVAVSDAPAFGLMQITDIALREYNEQTGNHVSRLALFNPSVNIRIGVWTLYRLKHHYGLDDFETLRAYNAGVTGAANNTNLSVDYAESVLRHQKHFRERIIET